MSASRRNNEQQEVYTRQATILRKNLFEWDRMLNNPRGEDWPTMVGRLNAALVRRHMILTDATWICMCTLAHVPFCCGQNQTRTLDRSIDDVLEHFVYLPKQSTANPQDIPFFLGTRVVEGNATGESAAGSEEEDFVKGDPVKIVARYENRAAELAAEYEESMVRF